jgi:ribonucleotide monophosphatase NagD (HAD superfamily)
MFLQDSVLTSSYLTACYLQDIDFKKKVYVVGTSGISRELNLLGIRNFGVGVSNQDVNELCIAKKLVNYVVLYIRFCQNCD